MDQTKACAQTLFSHAGPPTLKTVRNPNLNQRAMQRLLFDLSLRIISAEEQRTVIQGMYHDGRTTVSLHDI